jgi:hypothetical protein
MRNLERVIGSLLRVAERPGQDYTLLNELYGQRRAAVGPLQRPRRRDHRRRRDVGALRHGPALRAAAGGEAARGDALPEPERVPRAGHVPDPEILRRIEQEGVVNRIRAAQAGVLNSLLAVNRLNRLVEYEALAGPRGDSYTVAEFLGDLRGGVWSELTQGTRGRRLPPQPAARLHRGGGPRHQPAGACRRTRRRAGGAGGRGRAVSDARALLRGELVELQRAVQAVQNATNAAAPTTSHDAAAPA